MSDKKNDVIPDDPKDQRDPEADDLPEKPDDSDIEK